MDPFEEFEFKPITEGLGFQNSKKAPPSALPPGRDRKVELAVRELDFVEPSDEPSPFTKPLPRNRSVETPESPMVPAATPVDDILVSLKRQQRFAKEEGLRQRQELRQAHQQQETWKPTSPKLAPILLDGMLITSISLLCMIITLFTTRVDLIANLTNPDTEGMVYLATASLFFGVTFIYMILNRSFLGFTPGEWAYDLRMGSPEDLKKKMYPVRLALRQLLIFSTGLIPLTLMSNLLNKDLAGKVTGLHLHRKS